MPDVDMIDVLIPGLQGPAGPQGDTGAKGDPGDGAHVATLDALRAFNPVLSQMCVLRDTLRGGTFAWDGSNVSAQVAADTARGIYVPPVSDATGASGAWVRRWMLEIDVRWFGATAGADLCDPLKAALTMAAGARVRIPAGDWLLSKQFSTSNVHFNVVATGARIVRNFNPSSGFAISGTFSSRTTINSGNTKGSTLINVATSAAATYKAGDFVRVVSDDRLLGSYPNSGSSGYWRGEVVQIKSVNAITGNITFETPLLDSYPTNPKIGRYSDTRFNLVGGQWDVEEGHDAEGWNATLFRIAGIAHVFVSDFTSRKNYGPGFQIIGAASGRLQVAMSGYSNNQDLSQFGYCINLQSCTSVAVHGVFGRCRHGVTTTGLLSAPNTGNMESHGATRGCSFSGLGYGDAQAFFDTHHGSEDCLFHDIVVIGEGDSGSGIAVRGRGHRVDNILGRGGRYGINVFTEDEKITDPAHGTKGIILSNCDFRGCLLEALVVSDSDVTIEGNCYFSSAKWTVWSNLSSTVRVRGDITLSPGAAEDATDCVINNAASPIIGGATSMTGPGRIIVDAAQSDVTLLTNGAVLNRAVAGSALDMLDFTILGPSSKPMTLLTGETNPAPRNIRVRANGQSLVPGMVLEGNSAMEGIDTEPVLETALAANLTLTCFDGGTVLCTAPIAAARTIDVAALTVSGKEVHVVRSAAATGAFAISVKTGGTTIATLAAAGTWARVRYAKTAGWVVVGAGSLS